MRVGDSENSFIIPHCGDNAIDIVACIAPSNRGFGHSTYIPLNHQYFIINLEVLSTPETKFHAQSELIVLYKRCF